MALKKLNKHMSINEQVAEATKNVLDSGLLDHPADQNLIREMMNKLDVEGTIFEGDNEKKRLIVDEALKVASDKKKLESLRDFLVSGEVRKQLNDLFDPTNYINTLTQKIREIDDERNRAKTGEAGPMPDMPEVAEGGTPRGVGLPEFWNKKQEDRDVEVEEEREVKGGGPINPILGTPVRRTVEMEITETPINRANNIAKETGNIRGRVPRNAKEARKIRDERYERETFEGNQKELQKSMSEVEKEYYESIMEQNRQAAIARQEEEMKHIQKERAKKAKKKGLLAKITPGKASLIMGGGIGGAIGGVIGSSILLN